MQPQQVTQVRNYFITWYTYPEMGKHVTIKNMIERSMHPHDYLEINMKSKINDRNSHNLQWTTKYTLPKKEHWPLKGKTSLNYFGCWQASRHLSNQAEMIVSCQFPHKKWCINLTKFSAWYWKCINAYFSMCCRIKPTQRTIFWSWRRSVF